MTTTTHKRASKWLKFAAMSVVAPLLAGGIQSAWIATHGGSFEYYQALFYPHRGVVDLTVSIPIVVGIEALVTFFVILGLAKVRLWLAWPAFLFCCALWIYVAFISIARAS